MGDTGAFEGLKVPCPNEKPPRRCGESSKVTQRLRLVKYDSIFQNTAKVCKGKGLYSVFLIKLNDSMTDSVGHSHTYSTDIRRLQLLRGGRGAHSPRWQERSLAICPLPQFAGCLAADEIIVMVHEKYINHIANTGNRKVESHVEVPLTFLVNLIEEFRSANGMELREFGHQPWGTCDMIWYKMMIWYEHDNDNCQYYNDNNKDGEHILMLYVLYFCI